MLERLKLTATELLANPTSRTLFILGTIVIAVLVGGAPEDVGGG
jgi:hypothetical protein